MASVVINGDTSGSVSVTVPATAGSNTITLPAVTGTAVISGQNSAITAGTAVASTSGTSIDFTSIPSWVKRITVMLSGFSTSGTSVYLVQLGSGSVTTSGYLSSTTSTGGAAVAQAQYTTGFGLYGTAVAAASVMSGTIIFTNITGNTWVASGVTGLTNAAANALIGGNIALSGTLDRVRITTVNGTDTFDAGTINILYE